MGFESTSFVELDVAVYKKARVKTAAGVLLDDKVVDLLSYLEEKEKFRVTRFFEGVPGQKELSQLKSDIQNTFTGATAEFTRVNWVETSNERIKIIIIVKDVDHALPDKTETIRSFGYITTERKFGGATTITASGSAEIVEALKEFCQSTKGLEEITSSMKPERRFWR